MGNSRPWLLELAPAPVRQSLYHRLYQARHSEWPELFTKAPLALCPGMAMYDLVPGDVISGNIAFSGFYDLALSRQIVSDARGGGLFVDVGANMGYFALLWAGVGRGSAIAVEAAPRNIALLEKNCRLNGVADRVKIVAKAAADRAGVGSFSPGPAEQTGWGGLSVVRSPDDMQVELVRLDEELGGAEIRAMKIDVEGADALVLRGCERLLRERRIGRVYFEKNAARAGQLGIEPDAAQRLLGEVGYACTALNAGGTDWLAVPRA